MKRQRLAREAKAARLAQTKAPDVTETPTATMAPEEVGAVVEIEEDGCDGFICGACCGITIDILCRFKNRSVYIYNIHIIYIFILYIYMTCIYIYISCMI